MSATPCQATPAHIVREAFLDSRRAKSEGEWWAAGRIEELETELAESKAKLAQAHKGYGCELLDPNGTIWEHAAKVQSENDELKELVRMKSGTIDLWKAENAKLRRQKEGAQ